MTEKEILQAVFQEHYLTDNELEKLHRHIEEHKYYVNENIPFTITFDQAVFSWYDNIFKAILDVCNTFILKITSPTKDCFSLYFEVVEHWHHLKENHTIMDMDGDSLYQAIRDYVRNYSERKVLGVLLYGFI